MFINLQIAAFRMNEQNVRTAKEYCVANGHEGVNLCKSPNAHSLIEHVLLHESLVRVSMNYGFHYSKHCPKLE